MRRRATSVEDAGQGEGESARANRHQADAFRVCRAQCVERSCRDDGIDVLVPRDDHRLGAFDPFEAGRCRDREPRAGNRPGFRAHRQVVVRVAGEDLRGCSELEREDTGQYEDSDPMPPRRAHGPIVAIYGARATV